MCDLDHMRHCTEEENDAYDAMMKRMSVELHPVDRDALLKLASDLESDAVIFESTPPEYEHIATCSLRDVAESNRKIAAAIREACGVKDA